MKKKTLKTLLLTVALCAVTSVGAGMASLNASADTASLTSDTFKTLGASIRVKKDANDTTGDGIRFAIGLEDSVYQSMLADDELDNINVLVMPTQLIQTTGTQTVSDVFKIGYTYEKDLNDNGTIEENEKARPLDRAIVSNWTADTTMEVGKTYWVAYAYVYGIPGGNYDCDLTVRAYYLADDADVSTAVYTDITDKSTRSFAYVANAAINDVSTTQTEVYSNAIDATNEYSPYSASTRKALRNYTNYAVTTGDTDTVRVTENGITVLSDAQTWVVDKKTQLPSSQKYTIEQKVTISTTAGFPTQGFMFGLNYHEDTGACDKEYYYAYVRYNAAGIAAWNGDSDGWVWGGVGDLSFSGEVSLKVVRNGNAMRLYVNDTLVKELVDTSTPANGLYVAYRTEGASNPVGGFVTISEEPQYKLYTTGGMTPSTDTSLITATKDTLTVNSTALVWALDRYAILPSANQYTINTTIYNIDSRGNFATLAGVAFGMTETGGDYYYLMLCDSAARLGGWWGTNGAWTTVTATFSSNLLTGNVAVSIVRNGNLIRVYANNVCVLAFEDTRAVTPSGTAVAFRSEGATSKYDTITVSSATQMSDTIATTSNNASNVITATKTDNSINVKATVSNAETYVFDRTLVLPNGDNYTIEGTFTMQSAALQGFVFGMITETNFENNYYYAYVKAGGFGIASTGDSNWWGSTGWTSASATELQSGIAVGATYTLKIVRSGNTISMYINGYLAKTVTATTSRTGLIVGFRGQEMTEATFGNITITDNSAS